MDEEKAKLLGRESDSHDDDNSSKETEEDYKKRWRPIKIIYMVSFVDTAVFSSLIASLWSYVQQMDPNISETFLGWVNSSFCFCQIVGSIVFGIWCQYRPSIQPLLFAQVIMISGNLLYVYAQSLKSFGPNAVLIARILQGFAAGRLAVCRTVVSKSTTIGEKTKAFGYLALIRGVALFCGPVFQIAFIAIGDKNFSIKQLNLHLNIHSFPGLLGFFAELGIACFIICWFKEQQVDVFKGKQNDHENNEKPDFIAMAVISSTLFAAMTLIMFNDTIAAPFLMDEFAFTAKQSIVGAGILLSTIGVMAVIAFLVIQKVASRFGERRLLLFGMLLCLAGFIIILPWGNKYPILKTVGFKINNSTRLLSSKVGCPMQYGWCQTTPKVYFSQFLVGQFFVAIGLPAVVLLATIIYSKLLGPKKQGFYMGVFTAVGASARIVAPLIVSNVYKEMGPRWAFLVIDFTLISSISLLAINFHRVVPFTEYVKNTKIKLVKD